MESNSIELNFSSLSAVYIKVGDFINDEVFGRFWATQEQVGVYNTDTGAYDYAITFHSHESLWANRKFMMSTILNDGTRGRKEVSWHLTSPLVDHLQQIRHNLIAVGFYEDVVICIGDDVEKRTESKFLSYEGVDIRTALKNICDNYECEWWVDLVDGVCYLYLGKCENWRGAEIVPDNDNVAIWEHTEAEPHRWTPGVNLQSMSVQNNRASYANRIYAFGGTTNVPTNYRKDLSFKVTDIDGRGSFCDRSKPLKLEYFQKNDCLNRDKFNFNRMPEPEKTPYVVGQRELFVNLGTCEAKYPMDMILQGTASYGFSVYWYNSPTLQANIRFRVTAKIVSNTDGVVWEKDFANTSYQTVRGTDNMGDIGGTASKCSLVVEIENPRIRLSRGWHTLTLSFTLNKIDGDQYDFNTISTSGSPIYNFGNLMLGEVFNHCSTLPGLGVLTVNTDTGNSYRYAWIADKNGARYLVCFNHYEESTLETSSKYLTFINADDEPVAQRPADWKVGSEYKLLYGYENEDNIGLDVMSVPLGWYIGEYNNPFSLLTVGDNRLLLPISTCPDGYVGNPDLSNMAVVEDAVIFDKIYPRTTLKVTDVIPIDKRMNISYEDGAQQKIGYSEYLIKVTQLSGADFPFKAKYQQEGKALHMSFVDPSALTSAEKDYITRGEAKLSKLCGMEFDCNFSRDDDGEIGFLLIANETYGAMLPNDILIPEEGDICVLTNWDVRAMLGLGIIERAEAQLEEEARKYLGAIEENQYTFTCVPMMDPLLRMGYIESAGGRMVKNEHIWLKGDGSVYSLPELGDKVAIESETLFGGCKESRIIGYELRFDIPYDSPEYTVGETEAYSRLKQLEKQITKL